MIDAVVMSDRCRMRRGRIRRNHLGLVVLFLSITARIADSALDCKSMSVEEEGILCYEHDDACKCARPCAVYKVM